MEFFSTLFQQTTTHHLNILFLLGLALFGGTIGGKIFEKFKIPHVVGYIIIGIIIGVSGLDIVDETTLKKLQLFNSFALGLIGFMIGGELKKDVFKKYGKQFMYILLFEGIMAFVIVTLLIGVVTSIFFVNSPTMWALALLLGAISVSTAPAATTGVLWQYKTRGPLTTTVLGIVAMDDGLGLLIFAFASSVAASLIGQSNGIGLQMLLAPLYEIGGALTLGAVFGIMICEMLKRSRHEDKILAFSIGAILLLVGLSLTVHVDMILASMSLGYIVVNHAPSHKSDLVFSLIGKFTPPIYVLFFVLVGAKLNVGGLSTFTGLLVILYLVGRAIGKYVGTMIGAKLSNAPKTVQKYLPLCLLSQAGVAIGLSIFAGERFPGEVGNAIIIIVTATTFVVELLGPPCVKIAVEKAGEVGLNITEEDLIENSIASDIIDKESPCIHEGMRLPEIMKIFSNNDSLFYPVVNNLKEHILRGIITVDSIKNTLMVPELNDFLLAHDIMEPVLITANPGISVNEVKELLKEYSIEHLPVVTDENKVLGIIESAGIKRLISRKVLELQKKVDSLG